MAFEGKELEGKIGEFGAYGIDITDKGMIEISLAARIDFVAELEKLAAKTGTPIDDQAIAWVKKLMGR